MIAKVLERAVQTTSSLTYWPLHKILGWRECELKKAFVWRNANVLEVRERQLQFSAVPFTPTDSSFYSSSLMKMVKTSIHDGPAGTALNLKYLSGPHSPPFSNPVAKSKGLANFVMILAKKPLARYQVCATVDGSTLYCPSFSHMLLHCDG